MNTDIQSGIEIERLPAMYRSLRLAVVTETYPPDVNGVALSLFRLLEGMRRRNHSIQLVRVRRGASGDGGNAADSAGRFHEVLMRGMPVPRYPELTMGMPSKGHLVRLWANDRPDLVHIATEGPLGWSALQAARKLRLVVSTDFRTNFHSYSRHYGMGFLARPIMGYLRKFHNLAHCTMVPTQALRDELSGAGFKRLHVVGRGVNTGLFNPAHRSESLRASWGADEKSLVVICVGRLAAEKNLDLLIESFEAIHRRNRSAKLVLVGDGPLRSYLAGRCPSAVFAGHQSGQSLAEHYASADLFLFPSLSETFGNVVIEAMASGLPVVAFRHAAAAEVIDSGVDGVLAQSGDAAGFVSLAEATAAQPDRIRLLGQQAAVSACNFDWSAVVARFESLLESTIELSRVSNADTQPPALHAGNLRRS